jgi:hypothetical protein
MLERGVRPDISVFNALLNCWAKSSDRDHAAGPRVMQILAEIEQHRDLQPDIKTYTNVLDALKGKGPDAVVAAESLVQRMEVRGPTPTVHTYTALIQAYGRSRLPFKAVEAAEVLTRMKASSITPNIITYNAVLNACEHTDPDEDVDVTEEALRVACLTFDEIRSAPVVANHVTYGTFLGALGNLMPVDSRQEIVALVFRRCCMEGQVSPVVLKKLREAVESEERYQEMLRGHKENELPETWTCNVRESKARHQAA